MSRVRGFLFVLAWMTVVGCQRTPKQPATESAGLSSDEAREICLADPRGGLPIDDAIREHQRLAGRLPAKPEEWIVVGRGWVRKARRSGDPGFYVNVDACASAALHADSVNPAGLGLRSLALMNGHKFGEARDLAQTILRNEARDTVAMGTLSDAFLELGQFESAAAVAQQLMDVRPDMASYSRASYFRWLQGDADHAKQFIRYALNGRDGRDPEPAAWTLVQAGMLYWNEGDYEGADAVFVEALKWLPDYPAALVGRARIAMSRRQPQPAVDLLEKASRISPLVETGWLLGDAREMLGDSAGARREYDRVIREGARTDRLTLGLFYATKDRAHDDALRLIESERASRGGIYVDDAYAWALFRAGRITEARAASDRAIRLGTPDARLLYHAGAIRIAGNDRSGLELVRKALALNPRFDWTGAAEADGLLRVAGARVKAGA